MSTLKGVTGNTHCPAVAPSRQTHLQTQILCLILDAFMAKRKHLSRHSEKRPSRDRPSGAARGAGGPQWHYGVHAVLAALANPRRRCRRILVATRSGHDLEARVAAAAGADRPPAEVRDRRDIERLLPPGAVHQGVALLADPLPEPRLEAVCRDAAQESVVVILDQATDPRNVGAVLRSAAAFGAVAVVVQRRHAPEITGALAKAASGAVETVPLVRVTNLARAMEDLKEWGFWCVGLDAGARHSIAEAGLSGRVALVLGSEGEGLRRLTRERCDRLVRVPITGAVESLNLSNAAAIALYELARGRA